MPFTCVSFRPPQDRLSKFIVESRFFIVKSCGSQPYELSRTSHGWVHMQSNRCSTNSSWNSNSY
jgi:hypothetical protein